VLGYLPAYTSASVSSQTSSTISDTAPSTVSFSEYSIHCIFDHHVKTAYSFNTLRAKFRNVASVFPFGLQAITPTRTFFPTSNFPLLLATPLLSVSLSKPKHVVSRIMSVPTKTLRSVPMREIVKRFDSPGETSCFDLFGWDQLDEHTGAIAGSAPIRIRIRDHAPRPRNSVVHLQPGLDPQCVADVQHDASLVTGRRYLINASPVIRGASDTYYCV
jgi:hypothetical protein